MNKPDFELYLRERHMAENPIILDHDLPDAFDHWLVDQHIDDSIKYANEWKEAA